MSKRLQIAVLTSSYEDSDSIFKAYNDIGADFSAFNPEPDQYCFELIRIKKAIAYKQLTELIRSRQYDIIFNLCDGGRDEDYTGVEVAEFLEQVDLPIISPSVEFYNLSKRQMKYIANICQILTPKYFFAFENDLTGDFSNIDRIKQSVAGLKFPLLVKHHNSSGSLGLSQESKVDDFDSLVRQLRKIVKEYGGALVEEFIAGREFTVLVTENADDPENPVVYQPFECFFGGPELFKDFNRKMIDYESLNWRPVLDDEICTRLKNYSSVMFNGCNGSSLARCDYRMCDKTGLIYFLEINAQCGVCGKQDEYNSADYILEYGNKQVEFMENLLKSAFSKWSDKKKKDIDLVDFTGKFAKATVNIPRDTVLIDLTKFAHNLIRKIDIDRWPIIRRQTFMKKCVKINANLFLELKNQDLHLFDILAFQRASRSLVNVIIDENLRLIAAKDLNLGQNLILEENSVK